MVTTTTARSPAPPVRVVPLDRITLDTSLYPRAEPHSAEAVEDLAAAIDRGADVPPAVVYHTPDGLYLLSEGFLRHPAYELAGRGSMPCEVREGTRRQAAANAAGADRVPGVARVTSADKRRRAEILIRECPDWTDVKIAGHVGTTDKTVADVRRDLLRRSEIPNVSARREDSLGRLQPASKPRTVETRGGRAFEVQPSRVSGDATVVGSVVRHPLPDGRAYPAALAAHQFNAKHVALLDDRLEEYLGWLMEFLRRRGLSEAAAFEAVTACQRTLLPELYAPDRRE